MAKAPILVVLLPQLLRTLLEVSGQQSPCPEYFSYILNSATKEVMGQIQIPSPPKNVELHLKVALSIGVALPTSYVGQLKLAYSKEESVRLVERGKPLLYHLHFPLSQPIPSLTGIWFNRQHYCSGPHATGQVVTSITLEHTLYPPPALPLSGNFDSSHNRPETNPYPTVFLPSRTTKPPIVFPVYPTSPPSNPPINVQYPYEAFTTERPTYRPPTPQRPTYHPFIPQRQRTKKPTVAPTQQPLITFSDEISNNPFLKPPPVQQSYIYECGISNQPVTNNYNIINPLISMGLMTSPGQWPWLVALFITKINFEFQCAGSILTQKHVITAAHCCKLEGSQGNIPASTMLASLGRYRLQDWHQPGSVNREIASYTLHPDFNPQQGSADSDLAILTLREPVEFSPTIKPICMWYGSIGLDSVVNQIGFIVGWGKDEYGNPYVQEPRMAKAPIVSQETCLRSDQQFSKVTSTRTFCAGMRDGSGPCNGDSGSALMLYDPSTGRYQLRGIVSRSLLERKQMTCDLSHYVIFVDVAKYLSWIHQQIST